MNFLTFSPVRGSFLDRINPRNWIHGSLHPKRDGHERTAELLAPWLETELAKIRKPEEEVNPKPNLDAQFRLRNVGSARPFLARPRNGLPEDCPAAQVSPIASSVLLFDEKTPFVLDATPGTPVCFTRADGSWATAKQGGPTEPSMPENGVQHVVYMDRDKLWQLRVVRYCSKTPDCPNDLGKFQNAQLADAAREIALPVLMLFFSGWLFVLGLSRRAVNEDLAQSEEQPGPGRYPRRRVPRPPGAFAGWSRNA